MSEVGELLTEAQLTARLREEVAASGGPAKWRRKHKITENHMDHMISDGRAATLPRYLALLGYRQVARFEKT